jgi:large subunit ribosomal protein L17
MRHGRTVNHLGRTASHRKAMLANMACSLIEHKRINTTVAKAKALRRYVEPLITKSKDDSTHSRRTVFAYLKSKDAVTELFREVAPKVADRPGGYVRIIRTGFRPGDNAETAMIELVDFNTIYGKEVAKAAGKKRTRRGAPKKKAEGAEGTEATSSEEAAPKAKATRKKKADDSAADSSES